MNQQGFTLLELLLSVTIITMLAGLSLPVFESFVRRNDLDLTTQSVVSSIRRAEAYSRGVKNDSTWGVRFATSGVTLFKGASYAARDSAFDETIPIFSSMSVSGTSEVVFSKLTGIPNTTASVTLSSTVNDSRVITVNAEGTVNY